MQERLVDVDRIIEVLYSGSISEVAGNINHSSRQVSNFRTLNFLPELGLLKVDLNLLLILISSENDKILSSNQKKVLNLLILGSEESVDPEKQLTCDFHKDKILYSYFEGMKKEHSQKGKEMPIRYLPGRSVARYQIWKLGKRYGYSTHSINKALKSLTEKELLESFPTEAGKQNRNDRFKLSVQGCNEYIKKASGQLE